MLEQYCPAQNIWKSGNFWKFLIPAIAVLTFCSWKKQIFSKKWCLGENKQFPFALGSDNKNLGERFDWGGGT